MQECRAYLPSKLIAADFCKANAGLAGFGLWASVIVVPSAAKLAVSPAVISNIFRLIAGAGLGGLFSTVALAFTTLVSKPETVSVGHYGATRDLSLPHRLGPKHSH